MAYGINDSGQVVGWSNILGESAYHATIWESAYHATIWNGTTPTDLGTLGGSISQAWDINDSGQVIGISSTSDGVSHATIWNGTTPTDLGTLTGSRGAHSGAYGINDSGQVVGWSYTSGGNEHATLWNGTTLTDLNNFLSRSDVNAGWVLSEAYGINDNSWIIGMANNRFTGGLHAFLLNPCDTCPINIAQDFAPLPEPETYALFMAGLGLMGFIARRRKNSQA